MVTTLAEYDSLTMRRTGQKVETLMGIPYKFALLTHLDMVGEMLAGQCDSNTFTLDVFNISYTASVLGVQKLFEEGYEVVLFYSAFGLSLMRQIGHSVVPIHKTDIDVIKTLVSARKISKDVTMTLHADEHLDIPYLEKLLDMRIRRISYNTVSELKIGIKKAFDEGAANLVGGGVSAQMAKERGVHCSVVEPNEYSMYTALEQAKSVARAKREEKNSREQLLGLLKVFEEGVVYVDSEKQLIFNNNTACDLLKIRRSGNRAAFAGLYQALMIDDVLRDGRARIDNIVTINKEQLVVTAMPMSINSLLQGVVVFLRDVASVQNISGKIRENQRQTGFVAHYAIDDIKGNDPVMLRMKKMMHLYAPSSASTFIQGETGTGKELLAQSLHNDSPRSKCPFVAINCAALPDSLLESELFGYEEGAFTGASRGGKAGVFELAHTGTLFLDEVGDMGASAQLRLLRVLETKELIRVGGTRIIPVDIRVISASHASLLQQVNKGKFRADLFYRLAVLRLKLPPLRQRVQDIPLLLETLLQRYGKSPADLSPAMFHAMEGYSWPGNIRELKSFVESYLILLGKKALDETLFLELLREWSNESDAQTESVPPNGKLTAHGSLKEQLKAARRQIIYNMLQECAWNKKLAAKRLGISYNNLWRIMSSEETE